MDGSEPSEGDDVRADSDAGDDPSSALSPARAAIADRLAEYDAVLEVGVGQRPGVAGALAARGLDVTAVDVHDRSVPDGVEFVRDDIVDRAARLSADGSPERGAHAGTADPAERYGVDAVYALNLPPELQGPTLAVARAVDATFLFTTLGGDPTTVSTRTESFGRETLYVARE